MHRYRAFSITELLVVIAIIVIALGLFLVGMSQWRDSSAEGVTEVKLAALENLLDEYHLETGRYPSGHGDMGAFLEDVDSVAELYKITGSLQNADGEVVDGWGEPIDYIEPPSGSRTRPWFRSLGADQTRASALAPAPLPPDTDTGDDVYSSGAP